MWARVQPAKRYNVKNDDYMGHAIVRRNTPEHPTFACLSCKRDTACTARMVNDADVTSYVEGMISYKGKFRGPVRTRNF